MTSRPLYDWFHRSAVRHPDNIALEVGDVVLTYAELSNAAEWLAAQIESALGFRPRRVGLLASRSLATYVGYLAAQRLGATVVPMNPKAPVARNVAISADAHLDITIVDHTAGDQLADYQVKGDVPTLDLTGDRWRALIPAAGGGAHSPISEPHDDYAYIVYTSGSTGHPKGVPTTHANVSSFLDDVIGRFSFTSDSRVSQTFEVSFDGSIIEVFGAWGSGAALCIPQHSDVFSPVRFINAKRLTHWLSVPSVISFAKRLRALPAGSMPTLRTCLFGGEPLNMEQAEAWMAAAPQAQIHNCYGPTELTVIITGHPVPAQRSAWPETSNRSIPIGDIYPSMEWVLLDGDDLVPGDDGELCVRGPQRFPGYLDPANNSGRFVAFDGDKGRMYDGSEPLTDAHWYRTGDRCRIEHGLLVHLGRIDDQLKIRGHRIELGEIESVLRRHPGVVEVVVLAMTAQDGEIDLHAVHTGEQLTEADFVQLLEDLPVYMRPRAFHHRPEIPLTANGKEDRKTLRAQIASVL